MPKTNEEIIEAYPFEVDNQGQCLELMQKARTAGYQDGVDTIAEASQISFNKGKQAGREEERKKLIDTIAGSIGSKVKTFRYFNEDNLRKSSLLNLLEELRRGAK